MPFMLGTLGCLIGLLVDSARGAFRRQTMDMQVPLGDERPLLESVLGPMTANIELAVRASLLRSSAMLRDLANHLDGAIHGWSEGLHLDWLPSGQVNISGYATLTIVGTGPADLWVELTPTWYYGDRQQDLAWDIEAALLLQCQHKVDHGQQTVNQRTVRAFSPIDAATLLEEYTAGLVEWIRAVTIDEWRSLVTKERCGS